MKKSKEEILKPYLEEGEDWMIVTEGNALKAMESYAQQCLDARWISVKERLPEYGERVICFTIHGGIPVCYRGYSYDSDGRFILAYNGTDKVDNVTHWMPLPEPPKLIS